MVNIRASSFSGRRSVAVRTPEMYEWREMRCSSRPMSFGLRTKSTAPPAMALCGMLSKRAESSCAKVIPPSALMAFAPRVPSEAAPDRITPMARLPWSSARERKNASMGMLRWSRGSPTCSTPRAMVSCALAGAM